MKSKKLHLSLLTFFQLCVAGSFIPIISMYLMDYLHFSAIQVGVILSIASIPSIIAPLISFFIVDRLITSRKFLMICQISGAIAITILSFQQNYISVIFTYFIYMMLLTPTYALVNILIFHNIKDSSAFGSIRLWGTVGWIFAGWLVSFIWNNTSSTRSMPLALQISAIFSIIVVILTFKLPKIKLEKNVKLTLFPKQTIEVLKNPRVIFIFALTLICATADRFLSYGLPLFLKSIGTSQNNIPMIMSFGQFPEIIMLFALAPIIKKLGFKKIFLLSLILQIARYTIFWFNGPLLLTYFGISLHGFIFALFYVGSTIYLDNFTDINSRGSLHQIHTLIYAGVAGFLGNFMAGIFANRVMINGVINFELFWLVPGLISVGTFVVLALFMKRLKK
ncbi:MAG: MFS transporter [Spirochaetaceae bacterium]